ncbi:pyrroline-5-carboxylate reductase [Helicobacter sp. 13S00482-2]|nr:pyrroline-5-carboxylate reductase [Helicobacter sp. 13S00482-2]
MAKAIAYGISHSDLRNKYKLEIAGRDLKKAQAFIKDNHLEDIASTCLESSVIDVNKKIVILCVKPYALGNFQYKGNASSVYSVMAGVDIVMLKEHIRSDNYAKVMPNVGARYQKSSTAVCIEGNIKEEASEILSSFGKVVFVDSEALVDASIATGGSSPAFLALIAQALIDAGVREGIRRDDALALVRATFEGFAHLLLEQTPDEIISSITSPGGTTIEGLCVLEDRAVRGAIISACHQAVAKSKKKH